MDWIFSQKKLSLDNSNISATYGANCSYKNNWRHKWQKAKRCAVLKGMP